RGGVAATAAAQLPDQQADHGAEDHDAADDAEDEAGLRLLRRGREARLAVTGLGAVAGLLPVTRLLAIAGLLPVSRLLAVPGLLGVAAGRALGRLLVRVETRRLRRVGRDVSSGLRELLRQANTCARRRRALRSRAIHPRPTPFPRRCRRRGSLRSRGPAGSSPGSDQDSVPWGSATASCRAPRSI